ncbi:MAG: hypothetical protein KAU28_10395 [Phycisphaerae bacterium]|nr:hypothetical protein [Phycisphaerae bacterium]
MPVVLLISAMAAVLGTWAFLGLVLTGLGLAVGRLAGLRRIDADRGLMSFWMGLAVSVAFLQLWHLALPITWMALAAVSVPGIAGLLWNRRRLYGYLRSALPRKRYLLLALALVAVWLANRAIRPCTTYDSGLYHLNSVRWATEYPITPGLGNLHGRLAFNNANLLFAAMLEVGPWYARSGHLLNALIMFMLLAQCILGASRMLGGNHERRTASLFDLMLMTPAVMLVNHSWIASHSTDLPAAAVAFVAASRLFSLLLNRARGAAERNYDVICVMVLLSLAVCIKASVIVFAAAGCAVAIIVHLAGAERPKRRAITTLIAATAASGLLILPWLVRGVILSGYPVFPLALGGFDVDWRVPHSLIEAHRDAIVISARRSQGLGGWAWLRPWAGSFDRQIILPLVLTALAAAAYLPLRLAERKPRSGGRRSGRRGCLLLLPVLVGMACWFFTAPAVRFGFFLLWLLAATLVAVTFRRFAAGAGRRLLAAVLIAGVLLAVCNIKKFFRGPGADWGFYPTPTAEMKTFVTDSGLTLHVPSCGDQCWDAPLPCTPYPKANLRLRRAGDLSGGFVLDRQVRN